jgi:hypothetical protein
MVKSHQMQQQSSRHRVSVGVQAATANFQGKRQSHYYNSKKKKKKDDTTRHDFNRKNVKTR